MTDERGTDWQGTPPAPALSGERRVALVIGNGAYTQSQAALRNPRNDAEAFAKRLQEVNPAFDVTMALDVGRDAMEDALEKFEARLTNCDTALLFFAGHGLQVKGMNFLLPVDADIRQEIHLRRRAFSLNEVLEIMGRRVRRSSLVFLDACRDNPFARSLLAGLPAPEQARFMARSGLAEVKAGKGTFIAFATAPDNVALDGALGSTNSPFTAALVEHMAMPNVSINDMMTAVTRAVLQTTGDQQEPWIQSSLRERFCFHEPPAAQQDRLPPPEPQLAAQPVDDRTLEHAFWLSVERSTDPVELEAFLDRFPAGVFSKLAQERLNAAIYVASSPDPLRRALRRFPESPRAQAFRSAIARLEWARLEKSRDVEALKRFAAEVEGAPESELALTRILRLESSGRGGGLASSWRSVAVVLLLIALAYAVAVRVIWPPTALRASTQKVEDMVSKAVPRPSACTGVLVDIIGTDRRCLDPADPKNREFEDCVTTGGKRVCGPRMVVLPTGNYMRGSPDSEAERDKDEGPVREVTIGYHLAVGKYEVTGGDWSNCVADNRCRLVSGNMTLPITSVLKVDVDRYLAWLNEKIRLSDKGMYRLPTEAEWEYVARAKTSTAYPWGETFDNSRASKELKIFSVDKFPPNEFGVHGMIGNASEWVSDCYADNYLNAPTNGAAFVEKPCASFVVRGGSWDFTPRDVRAANRSKAVGTEWGPQLGFRLARTLLLTTESPPKTGLRQIQVVSPADAELGSFVSLALREGIADLELSTSGAAGVSRLVLTGNSANKFSTGAECDGDVHGHVPVAEQGIDFKLIAPDGGVVGQGAAKAGVCLRNIADSGEARRLAYQRAAADLVAKLKPMLEKK